MVFENDRGIGTGAQTPTDMASEAEQVVYDRSKLQGRDVCVPET